ncbi:MAG: protein kinase, partial [Anaerolineae bacterium]
MATQDFLIGTTLTGKRGQYQPLELLGAGLTARVYRAEAKMEDGQQIQVAIKVMRPGLDEAQARRFRAEATNLAALLSNKAKAAPIYYEAFETAQSDAQELLVLELMRSRPVEKILMDGPLSEDIGLNLGLQLVELLQILHDRMSRTYTDLKFENLWWDQELRELKVTDWNVLSDPGQLQQVPVDLLRASRYLYRVLTGDDLQEQGGRITRDFKQHPQWGKLSLATQTILRKAFYRNPLGRYQSATELAKVLREIVDAWNKKPSRILADIDDLIGDHPDPERDRRAHDLLDILERRYAAADPTFTAHDADTLSVHKSKIEDRLRKEESLPQQGIHLFRGRSFKEAEDCFVKMIAHDPWILDHWRWREAARAGIRTTEFGRLTGDVEVALCALNAGEFERAEQRFIRLLPETPALENLLREARGRRLLGAAERAEVDAQRLVEEGQGDTPEAQEFFDTAQRQYGEAADAISSIAAEDYRTQLLDELGDLAKRGRDLADEKRHAAATATRCLREAISEYQAGNLIAARHTLEIGLEAVPGEHRLLDACQAFGQKTFASGRANQAAAFFALKARYAPDDTNARDWWKAAASATEAHDLIVKAAWLPGLAQVENLLRPDWPANIAHLVITAVHDALDLALERTNDFPDLATLRRLFDAIAQLGQADVTWVSWVREVADRWVNAVGAWIDTRHVAGNAGPLAQDCQEALRLTSVSTQSYQLYARLLPTVCAALRGRQRRLEPGVPELLNVGLQLETNAGMRVTGQEVATEFTRLTAGQVTDLLAANQVDLAISETASAVAAVPENIRASVARGLQQSLLQMMNMVPPEGDPAADLNLAQRVCDAARKIENESQASSTGEYALAVNSYQARLNGTRNAR